MSDISEPIVFNFRAEGDFSAIQAQVAGIKEDFEQIRSMTIDDMPNATRVINN